MCTVCQYPQVGWKYKIKLNCLWVYPSPELRDVIFIWGSDCKRSIQNIFTKQLSHFSKKKSEVRWSPKKYKVHVHMNISLKNNLVRCDCDPTFNENFCPFNHKLYHTTLYLYLLQCIPHE